MVCPTYYEVILSLSQSNDRTRGEPNSKVSIYNAIVESFFINRLLFNYRWFRYSYSFILICVSAFRTVLFVLDTIKHLNSTEASISFAIRFTISEFWIFYIVLESLIYPSSQFIKQFDSIWSKLHLLKESEAIVALKKSTETANITSTIIVTVSLITDSISTCFEYIFGLYDDFLLFIGTKLTNFIATLIGYNLLRGFLISGALIKSGHQHLRCQVVALKSTIYVADLTLYQIRHAHFELLRCGASCDEFFRRFVTVACSTIAPIMVIILYNLAYTDLSLAARVNYILVLVQISHLLLYFFPCLIGFHSYPGQVSDDIYQSTLVERSDNFKLEALLFMDLINQRSAGIRFMGLYLITPDIVPNLATLVFTYVMSIPNFLATNQ